MKFRELVRLLDDDGWRLVTQRGSDVRAETAALTLTMMGGTWHCAHHALVLAPALDVER
jgi:hypothetical protein